MIRITLEGTLAGRGARSFPEKGLTTKDNLAHLLQSFISEETMKALREGAKLVELRKRRRTRKARQELVAAERMVALHETNAEVLRALMKDMKVEVIQPACVEDEACVGEGHCRFGE